MSYHVDKGEVVALVGESGAGKSASAMAVTGLLPEYAEVSGSVRLHGDELIGLSDQRMSRVRGKAIGTVFQDPMSALTPVYTVGDQIAEAIEVHNGSTTRRAARARAVELLDLVGIAQPERRARAFPHELSGGERQRADHHARSRGGRRIRRPRRSDVRGSCGGGRLSRAAVS